MLKQSLIKLILLSAILVTGCAFSDESKIELNKLAVTGEAILYKPADQVILNLGVITEDANASTSLNANNGIMEAVMNAIASTGIDKSEYQTGRFTIDPIYSTPPQNANANWRAKITGYRVSNIVNIQTSKLNMVGKLIDAASKAGANSIGDISFNLSDHQKYRAEAIKAAAKNAIDDATALADATQLKLDKILTIELDPLDPPQPLYKSNYALRSASFDAGTSIESGDIEVRAKVAVTYEISER